MPKFKVESKSKYSAEETYKKIKDMLESDKDLRRLDSGYACQFNDGALTGTAKGKQFQADLTVSPAGGGSSVAIEVNLPLLLTPVKGMVQTTLQKKLDSALA